MDFTDTKKRNWVSVFWGSLNLVRGAMASAANEWCQTQSVDQTIRALNGLEDYQLEDMGLCRSELTPDGLSVAAARRAAAQDEVSKEIARLTAKSGSSLNGD